MTPPTLPLKIQPDRHMAENAQTLFHRETTRRMNSIVQMSNWSVRSPSKRTSRDLEVILESGLFDHEYYVTAAELGRVSQRKAMEHYITVGDGMRLKPNSIFDTHFYHVQNPDVEQAGQTALLHYIKHGEAEGRWPHPLFSPDFVASQLKKSKQGALSRYLKSRPGLLSPHPEFDSEYVLEQLGSLVDENVSLLEALISSQFDLSPSRTFDSATYRLMYPDIKDLQPFYHFVRWGRAEGRVAVPVKGSVASCVTQIEEAALLDPDIVPPHTNIHLLTRIDPLAVAPGALRLYQALRDRMEGASPDCIFFVPSLAVGGAERVAVNLATAISRLNPAAVIAFVQTEADCKDALSWGAADAKFHVISVADEISGLPRNVSSQIIANFIQTIDCHDIIIANSASAWDMIEQYGKALSSIVDIHVFAFCYDFDAYGRRAGYAWTHLSHCINEITTVVSDNLTTAGEIASDLGFESAALTKFAILYQPAPAIRQRTSAKLHPLCAIKTRPTVLWAGRFSPQKDLGLGLSIARACPEMTFVFAGGDVGDSGFAREEIPLNVTFAGHYRNFSDLLTGDLQLFLYTSAWDGLPNVLLEAGSAGLKIVTREVGGVPELISTRTGWPLAANAPATAFAAALRDAAAAGAEKVQELQKLISERHTPQRLADQVRLLGWRSISRDSERAGS